ncbi:MAG: sulfite exporter TauE/SafE family protein, partial [Candidatus Dadabacteria bacterium]
PREGRPICYTVCNRAEGLTIAGVGALFMGMISTGLGELNGYFLLQRCRVPSRVAVATSVFVVAVTALVAASGHMWRFAHAGGDGLRLVVGIAVFTVPGVVVGGQIGPALSRRIPQRVMERSMGVLFLTVAALTLWEVVR